ncbi:MAG TPA: helix-turn-helix transcriptional regulator, partial [Gemmataceae bacterium]|nr:helix-turn-helix transcriptional regulator [Gemmataceae bacterium]
MVDELRATITASGLSLNQLSKASGVDSGTLSRFVRGERTITLPAADKILRALHKRVVFESDQAGEGESK